MFKYTKHFLKKVEDLFSELNYTIRYERGNFKSGYCIVEDRQIAVINRFFEVEARINVLIEILSNIDVDTQHLDDKNLALFKELSSIIAEKETEESKPAETTTATATNEAPVMEGEVNQLAATPVDA